MKMTNYYMFFASIIFVGVISINGQTWPLNSNNELSSAFGPRNLGNEDYPGDNYDYDFHPGTDIGGTGDVVAIDWGTVVWKDNLFGNPANPYIAIDYGSAWIQYVHITSTLSEGTDVEAGDVIGQVTDNHLDVRFYYPLDNDPTPPYRRTNHFDLTWNIMDGVLLTFPQYPTTSTVGIDPTLYEDEIGKYITFSVQTDDEELDLVSVNVNLEGYDEDGFYFTTHDILAGDGNDDNSNEYDNYVDFDVRKNCGDNSVNDNDQGKNNSGIRIIPEGFCGGVYGCNYTHHDYQTVNFRFYLNEDVVDNLTELGVRVEYWDLSTGGSQTNLVPVSLGICPPNCPPSGAPDAPANLTVTPASDGIINLSWERSVSPEDGFHVIYRRPIGSDPLDYRTIDITSAESFQDIYFEPGEQYYYAVAGVNAAGEGLNSNEVLITAPSNNPPAAPTNLRWTNSGGNPRIAWNANNDPDLDHYKLYITYNNGSGTSSRTVITESTSYTDTRITISRFWDTLAGYKVTAFDLTNQESSYSNQISVKGRGPQWKEEASIPESFALYQSSPNPFNPITNIRYALPVPSIVKLTIYDYLGREITTLVNRNREDAGFKNIVWNGKDQFGKPVASGMYIYTIDAVSIKNGERFYQSMKMVMLK